MPVVTPTPIPGLLVVDLPLMTDSRGWFKENWQREKMVAAGLPDFAPVQNNVSYNEAAGTTRGIHAEPWDKYVSVTSGRVFGAWVDLRRGTSFGATFTIEIGPDRAVFVPRGVGNAYQTLEPHTAYTYLVTAHWRPDAAYSLLNLADESAGIRWPLPLDRALVSEKDQQHPRLADVTPVEPHKTLIIGAGGQLGQALASAMPEADAATRADIDLSEPGSLESVPWQDYDTVINAAAHTAVDDAETPAGRVAAWRSNVTGVARLARHVAEHRLTLVHVSSDYVFDGSTPLHTEDETPSPLGVYGQSKAAADAIVATLHRHYIVRTSWVIGEGNNFVRTMVDLAARGIDPRVVNDQHGRLTFTSDLAAGIRHLLDTGAAFGSYNLSNDGPEQSWADVAAQVFALAGHDPARVLPVSTADYLAGRSAAPRPRYSTLDLSKIRAAGFTPRPALDALREYLGGGEQ